MKPAATFRNYDEPARDTVREFYRQNHAHQTLDFVLQKKAEYLRLARRKMTVWEALDYLNTLVDDSDPDVDFTQIDHALQTAEAVRKAGQPRWLVAAGLIHDLGKVLCLFGEPQWAVVGDTFPVGCAFSDRAVYPEYFALNPDATHPIYSTEHGIYESHCGLDHVHMSWGHDEYIFHVVKDCLPIEALYALRYHSFYPWHKEGAYEHLANDRDRQMLTWVKAFNRYDLYSKSDAKPDLTTLRPFYDDLIAEFFPEPLNF